MVEAGEESAAAKTNPSPKPTPLCEECKKEPSKYKCPGCSMRTCSLPCVKAHKERSSCTGKKQYKDVVPISQFDDNLLLSDYNMLEDVKRVAKSGRRMGFKAPHFRLPFPLKHLRNAAASRRTKILFFSSGMSKRENNRTYYNYRKKYITWTIEWRFHATDVVLTDHGIHENRSLCSVLENHLKPGPWKHQLKQFCEEPLDSLKLFIRKYPKGPRSPFRELNIKASIREQLANIVILEYPIVHVFLPTHTYDFEVIRDTVPSTSKIDDKESVRSDDVCQPGVIFREEEIEEGCSSDPLVSNLMNTTNIDVERKTYCQKPGRDKKMNKACDNKLLTRSGSILDFENGDSNCRAEYIDTYIGHKSGESASDNMDFDVEQGLIDAYTEIVAQTNQVKFLDFGCVLTGEACLERGRSQADISTIEEELEEGEIA